MPDSKREYKLAQPSFKLGVLKLREIVEITDDGHRSVIVIVADHEAMDVRDALARAYQDGREDNAAMLEAEGRLRQ